MKHRGILALLIALAGLALLIGCQPAATANWAASTDCKACHSGETSSTYGPLVLANKAGYENSGHFNGPRVLIAGAVGQFEFDGSDAMYCNGVSGTTACSKCHTSQGFVSWLTTGTAGNQEPASPPGCFTCHKPHETGDFSLRTEAATTLVDGTTYNYGAGNLCANCHQSLTGAATWLAGPYATTTASPVIPVLQWASYNGSHHGPQSDIILGKNFYAEGANTYAGASAHVAGAGAPADSCVSCHKFDPATGNLSGSLELGGHGFYLTGDVHGAQKDITALCKTCHASAGTTFPTTHLAPADWDGNGSVQDKLLEIKGLRNTLLGYFATAANFPGGTPTPIVKPDGVTTFTLDGTGVHNEWHQDWVFNQSSTKIQLDAPQSQAYWNLKLSMEDRSGGIHNPTFVAQILYDSIDILNLDANYPVTLTKGTRPQ